MEFKYKTTPTAMKRDNEDTDCGSPIAKYQRTGVSSVANLKLAPAYLIPTGSSTAADPIDSILISSGHPLDFHVGTLAAGIAQGCTPGAINAYLASFTKKQVAQGVKKLVSGQHPVLFYALERNCIECVRALLEYGCNARATDHWDVPALAYAIMRSKWTAKDPTEVVKSLLGYGAVPEVVPKEMWDDFLEVPIVKLEAVAGPDKATRTSWCHMQHREILSETLNVSVRYFLHKASLLPPINARSMQLAKAHDYVALLKVPYLVIGQTFACKFVVEHVTSHIGMNNKAPLVLTFAGLSGHGKTELAKQMGTLLRVPITVIDCAQIRTDAGLFGSRLGYAGNAGGSQLNNHLAKYQGERSVVFMDEFDKTDQEVRNSLLLLLDSGDYHDRRNNKPVDASKTIWILATNLGDKAITSFYREHMEGVTDATAKARIPHKLVQSQLKQLYRDHFGAPMAGRMKNVAPFYPFDAQEQAVVTHKFLTELIDQVRLPIDRSPTVKRYPGHVHLALKNDGQLCSHIARTTYISELGARSLTSGIDDVRREFYTTFVESEELVTEEMNKGPLMKYTVQLVPVVGGAKGDMEVSIVKDGFTTYYQGQEKQKVVEGLATGFALLKTSEVIKAEIEEL